MILLTYESSSGRKYNLKSNGILTKEANYHTWVWNPEGTQLQFGQRVSSFSREAVAYSTTIYFEGSYNQRAKLSNQLHEDFELDVRNMKTGRVTWGSWHIDCYVTASSTAPEKSGYTENKVTFYCPHPFWRKEEKKSFFPQEAPPLSQTFLDYEYDFNYEYFLGAIGNQNWVRDFAFSSEFRMIIYGAVSNPRVVINGYPYQINDTLEPTEYLIIDSRNHTIMKHLANDSQVSIFDKRDKVKSVFEQIPAGTLNVSWTGLFGFDLTLYNERSEPTNDMVLT